MTAIVILGVIALVAAIVAWVTWHRGADERLSVQHHQHTLETLRHVADRRQQSPWPVPGRRAGASNGRPTSSPRPGVGRGQPAEPDGALRHWENAVSARTCATSSRRGAGASRSSPDGSAPVKEGSRPARRAPVSPSAKESAKVGAGRRESVVFADDGRGVSTPRSTTVMPSMARRIGAQLPGAAEQSRRQGRAACAGPGSWPGRRWSWWAWQSGASWHWGDLTPRRTRRSAPRPPSSRPVTVIRPSRCPLVTSHRQCPRPTAPPIACRRRPTPSSLAPPRRAG